MTEELIKSAQKNTAVASLSNIPEPGIRPLILRICMVWLFIFFADSLVDLLLNAMELLWDGILSFIAVFFQFEAYLAHEFIAEKFDLSTRKAELIIFYGLLPFELLILKYIILKFIHWMKRIPEKFNRWKFKETTLIENSWLLLEWYSKLAVIGGMLSPIAFLFMF